MNTNIFVPSKINVGFQNRKDTYTGKLAYVIYFDEKGKLRKETSWNSWRDENIPNEIYENEPMDGFVLNRRAGGVEESWGWNPRKTYCRVCDPRGFEFEITIANLLWILENCNSIKGKGLEGEFVYGWDGKELVLVPVESPDYKEIEAKNKVIHNNEFIKAKDLIVGATYRNLKDEKFVFMGKFNAFDKEYNSYHEPSRYSFYKVGYEYDLDDTWKDDILSADSKTKYRFVDKGKYFFFIKLRNPNAKYSWDRERDEIVIFKTINKKMSEVINKDCHENYINFVKMLNKCCVYSPIDYSKSKITPLPFENFKRKIDSKIQEANERRYCSDFSIGIKTESNEMSAISIGYKTDVQKFYTMEKEPYEDTYWGKTEIRYKEYPKYYESIEELYKEKSPIYGEYYLENDCLYERKYYYE